MIHALRERLALWVAPWLSPWTQVRVVVDEKGSFKVWLDGDRLSCTNGTAINWGGDTQLYRSNADKLVTDDSIKVNEK